MTFFNFDKKAKKWNNRCPECGSRIKWSLGLSRHGTESTVHCSNSLVASRLDMQSLEDLKVCFWKGYVVRQKDGGVRFRDKNKQWIK
jgi:hypothetical protein